MTEVKSKLKNILRILIVFLCVICLLGNYACGGGSENTNSFRPRSENELLDDPNFQRGFNVKDIDSSVTAVTPWRYSGTVDDTTIPGWYLAQHCKLSTQNGKFPHREGYLPYYNNLQLPTIFDDVNDPEKKFGIEGKEGDYYTLTNYSGSKKVYVNTSTGQVSLEVNTRNEYIDQETNVPVKRKSGEDWVHLTMRQGVGVAGLVSSHEHLWVEIEFTVSDYLRWNNDIGASQFMWVFSVSNTKSTSNDYFWCNLTFFDTNYLNNVAPEKGKGDLYGKADATGKYIYNSSSEQVGIDKIEAERTYKLKIDIIPIIQKGFEMAQENDYLEGALWEDMALSEMNLGWEVSEISRARVDIDFISLWYE